MAAIGARMMVAIIAIGLEPSRSSLRPPPKIAANCIMRAVIMMAAATVAATELIRMSRCFTCASSCAMTPSSSGSVSSRMIPSVAATAAWLGFRPVANAFGELSGITYTFGMGRFARVASRRVMIDSL